MTSIHASEHALAILDKITGFSVGLKNGSDGSREGLIDACASLITELQNPTENMLDVLWAQPAHLNILWMSVEIKLFQALATVSTAGVPIRELAAKCANNPDPVLVGRMLRHLAAMGTVRETGPGTFAPTPTSIAFAEPGYQDSIFYMAGEYQPLHQALPSFFRENGFQNPESDVDGPFQHAFNCKGQNYFDYFEKVNPEMGKRFATLMQTWSNGRPRWFEQGYYPVAERLISGAKEDKPFVVDVGGSVGHDIEGLRVAFGEKLPGPLILQDRPEILENAQVGRGIQIIPHNFFNEQPVKGARAYFLHSIAQDWNDENMIKILKAIMPAMQKGYSKILVNDFVVPNQGAHWEQTCLDWELMNTLCAKHRTEYEHRALYTAAGLKVTGIWNHRHGLDSSIELELA